MHSVYRENAFLNVFVPYLVWHGEILLCVFTPVFIGTAQIPDFTGARSEI